MTAPDVTVVIPTYARPQALQACLDGLARQSLPGRLLEVVVVDDGSPVPVRPLAPDGLELRVLRQARAGPGAARNAGVRAARGVVVAFTDDDCVPDRDWLTRLLAAIDGDPEGMCAGAVVSGRGVGLCAEASQQLITYLCAYYNRDRGDARFVTANNLASTRRLLEALGGFDAERMPIAAGEDRELCERARRHGAAVRFVPEAVVVHNNPLTLGGFLRLHVRYGRGARLLHVARPGPGRSLQAEPPRFYLDLVRLPFGANTLPRALALSCLLSVSQAAHALGYVAELVSPTTPGRGSSRA